MSCTSFMLVILTDVDASGNISTAIDEMARVDGGGDPDGSGLLPARLLLGT